jgi:hypothetical protein
MRRTIPEIIAENVGELGEDEHSREGEREGTVKSLRKWGY